MLSDSRHSVMIATERLLLKSLDENSVDAVLAYYMKNRTFLAPWEPMRNEGFYTVDVQAVSLKLDREAQLRGEMIRFWIYLKDSDEIVGTVSLTNIIRGVLKSCFLGYKISQDHARKGYMSEAVAAAITYAFESLKLHRLEANIMPKNFASLKLIQNLGFEQEGLSKSYLKINGQWEDHFRFALLNKEYVDG